MRYMAIFQLLGNCFLTAFLQEEYSVPLPLTAAKTSPLSTVKVKYINNLLEYLINYIHGYTYVISAGGRSNKEMEQLTNEVSGL